MKIVEKFVFLLMIVLVSVTLATAYLIFDDVPRGEAEGPFDIHLKHGDAAVWYLSHAGWAVKTSSVLMIFDYLPNGFLDPHSIKDQNVYVFISHGHGDHFDRNILSWKEAIPNISYIFGWNDKDVQGHHVFGKERTSMSIGPLRVKNIFHDFDNIPESAFLVEVDGLTIYFSGDHGGWAGALNPVYKDNIDYMSQRSNEFALVFLSIFGSPTYDAELYAIKQFAPRVVLPMHLGGREADAEGFIRLARIKYPKAKFWFPLRKGDGFLYKNGEIIPISLDDSARDSR
ncbi:MAG: MBL fold metallo-hydrolase [Candidatus Aminicenantes bacterium]|jgi:L-ascorbate metabolism protein UlaG (beta-lactamase superfamily)